MSNDREAFIAGLRALADHYEAHPDLHLPHLPDYSAAFHIFPRHDLDAQSAALGGLRRKEWGDELYGVTRDFGGGVTVSIKVPREQVCERVQVGTKKKWVPAPDAPMVEVEEPVYTWVCNDVESPPLATVGADTEDAF